MSPGAISYLAANLDAGYYVALCFIGDPNKGGAPHAFEGTAQIFTVGDV